ALNGKEVHGRHSHSRVVCGITRGTSTPGAQTERRGDPGPGRDVLGGGASPAPFLGVRSASSETHRPRPQCIGERHSSPNTVHTRSLHASSIAVRAGCSKGTARYWSGGVDREYKTQLLCCSRE